MKETEGLTMCRLLAYKGAPIIMVTLLYQPKNSLIKQSYDAKEIEEPLNGDGFGIGWYVPELSPEPAVFVSVFPAWSNRNLRGLAPRIKSGCLFAHVRAASFGDTSEANCHPFHYKQFMMMHNGSIEGFNEIKRPMRARLSDEIYGWVKGQTDSEHFFALFLDRMLKLGKDYKLEHMAHALQQTIDEVEALKRLHGIKEGTYLNCMVSDGKNMVGTRFLSTKDDEPLSLYWSEGARYICEGDSCRMESAHAGEQAVLIVSEKLTSLADDWKKIPDNHMIMVDEANHVTFRSITVDPGFQLSAA
jgi:predicted glutamine amidotransferase